MDSIAKTTGNAFVGYFNTLRRMGGASLSERYKLMVLWFFDYLRNNSDFVYYYETGEDETNEWRVDHDLVDHVERVFRDSIMCLSGDTCNIRLMDGDCTPVENVIGFADTDPVEKKYLIVLNETDPIDTSYNTKDMDFNEALASEIWQEGSGFVIDNDHNEENVYFEYNVKSIT